MTDTAVLLAQSDFKIPAPKSGQDNAAQQTPAAAGPIVVKPSTSVSFDNFVGRPIATTDIAIGAGVFVVLLVIFFFAKLATTRGLQSRYAAPGPASEAGWMLFAWLAVTALLGIVAVVGNLWSQAVVVGPAALASLILLILFLRKRSHALATRR